METKEVAEKLDAIAAEIEQHPERWTQGTSARDADGRRLEWDAPEAAMRCAANMICAACDQWPSSQEVSSGKYAGEFLLMRGFVCEAAGDDVVRWNDTPGRTPAEVADAFRKAAELARSAQ